MIQRFNELYSRERLNAMDLLRTVSDDYEMNQRVCFNIIQVRKKNKKILFSIKLIYFLLILGSFFSIETSFY